MNVSQRKSVLHIKLKLAGGSRQKKCPEEKGYESKRMGLTADTLHCACTVGWHIKFVHKLEC